MSRKIKRNVTSLSYSINKITQKISSAKPSTLIISIIAISAAIFLLGGGLYDIITHPAPAVYYNSRFIFLYPQLSEQFMTDSIISIMLYSIGIIGLITVYQSTKYAYNPRQAYMMFLVGTTLLLLSYILLESAIRIKLGI
jgi:hypothetical protein